jgi:hypothetical protein
MGRSILALVLVLFTALVIAYSGPSDTRAEQAGPIHYPAVSQQPAPAVPNQSRAMRIADYGKIPLYFIPNQGQADGQALFYAKTSCYTLWMTREGLVFDATIAERKWDELDWKKRMMTEDPEALLCERLEQENKVDFKRDVSRVVFLGANKHPRLTALDPAENHVNYFIGNDPTKWKADIPSSRAVLYEDLYPEIDLKVYGVENQVEYDWIVKPGAGVEDIRFEYQDVKAARIDANGDLVVETAFGQIKHQKPISYQWTDGREVDVSSTFKDTGTNAYGFEVGSYDRTRDLFIDPILVYSTYLGGSGDDFATDIAVDKAGAAYVVGYTTSTNFPVAGAYQNTNKGSSDVFVAKFSPSGKTLVYSTFLGGGDSDEGYGIALDASGAAYITGMTSSSDFPILNAYQETIQARPDAFVTKLNPAGASLAYSSYLGGWLDDRGLDIAVDGAGAAYVTGWTGDNLFYQSVDNNFPMKNPYQGKFGRGRDAFVSKFTPAGNDLIYSTFLGGSLTDEGRSIAVDARGCAYLTGYTNSSDFPLRNPCQSKIKGSVEAYVAKFSAGGNTLVYSTYLGGSWWDWSYEIRVDGSGAAYLTGETYSQDFPVKNAYQKRLAGLLDVFITRLNPAGSAVTFSTFLGGSNYEEAGSLAIDGNGNCYVAGETYSADFPLQNPLQKRAGGGDVFLAKVASTGAPLAFSTYLGGGARDRSTGLAADLKGAVYVAGETYSSDFPAQTAYQKTNRGGWDAFVAKLDLSKVRIINRQTAALTDVSNAVISIEK